MRVIIELTTRCDHSCSFCPRTEVMRTGKRRVADMDWPLLKKTVSRLAGYDYQFDWIALSGLGEPLLYPHLIEAIQLVKSRFGGVCLKLNTNAANLKGALAGRLIDSGLDRLMCSLNVVDEVAFRAFKNQEYGDVIDGVTAFLKMKGNRLPATYILVNTFDVNLNQVCQAKNFWDRHLNKIDRFSLGLFSNWGGKIDRNLYVSNHILDGRTPCRYFDDTRTFSINVDGYIFPCCVSIAEAEDSVLCLGNIKDERVTDTYLSLKVAALKHQHEMGIYPGPCLSCDSWGIQDGNLKGFRGEIEKASRLWALRRVGKAAYGKVLK